MKNNIDGSRNRSNRIGSKGWLALLLGVGFFLTIPKVSYAAIGPDSLPNFPVTQLSQGFLMTPTGVERFRGIIFARHVNEPIERELRVLMHHWQFSLIFDGGEVTDYNKLIQEAASKSGHPEIANLPIIAVTARDYTKEFLNQIPDSRLIGIYCWQGSGSDKGGKDVLRIVTDYEVRGSAGREHQTAAAARGRGEPVAYGPIWGWPRGSFTARDFYAPLLDWAVRTRLPSGATPADGKVTLKPLDRSQAWVGDPNTWNGEWPMIYPEKDFKGDLSKTSWLPNEEFAQLWRAYVSKDPELTMQQNRMFGTLWSSANYGQTHTGSSPPRIGVVAPVAQYSKSGKNGDAPLVPRDTILFLTVRHDFGEDVEEAWVLEGSRRFATLKPNPLGLWTAIPCTLKTPGYRSLIVHARLKGGKMVTSRPATVIVSDREVAKGNPTVVPHTPIASAPGITTSPNLGLISLGAAELPGWTWKAGPKVTGHYDPTHTFHLTGNGQAIYMCWDRAGFAFVQDIPLDGDFVLMGRLAKIPETGPGTVGLTVKGGLGAADPVLDLRWDYYWQDNHPQGVGLSWFNRHTPANYIGFMDNAERGDCATYPAKSADTICVFQQGCLGRGFENRVPGFTKREDLWLAVQRSGSIFRLYARYGSNGQWIRVDPTPFADGKGSEAAVKVFKEFVVPAKEKNRVYAGFTAVGVNYGDNDMPADIDNITLVVGKEAVEQFPSGDWMVGTGVQVLRGTDLHSVFADGRQLHIVSDVQGLLLSDVQGRIVRRAGALRAGTRLDLDALPRGVYRMQAKGADGTMDSRTVILQ